MARGGLHDVVGGGFHRYSVTSDYHVPHFEKMLSDNAQLAVSYLEAFQCTNDEEFFEVARSTLNYIVDRLTAPGGLTVCAPPACFHPAFLLSNVW